MARTTRNRAPAAKAAKRNTSVPLTAVEGVLGLSVDTARGRYYLLTPREAEVAELMAAGIPNRQIAEKLGISPKTLDIHRGHVMEKLGASTSATVANVVNVVRFAEAIGG
jgi:DNA-binding CsgD family transcriptional regulator